jgi:Polyketide cyclase / dehydrase and lipid transport
MQISLTQTVSIASPPELVFDFVADPRNLPLWAPAFATSIERDGEHWLVHSGGAQLRLEVRASRELGTVDFLAADAPPDRPVGAYSRVVHNGAGSEYLFTRFVARETRREDRARERAVLAEELEAVRRHCESSPETAAA